MKFLNTTKEVLILIYQSDKVKQIFIKILKIQIILKITNLLILVLRQKTKILSKKNLIKNKLQIILQRRIQQIIKIVQWVVITAAQFKHLLNKIIEVRKFKEKAEEVAILIQIKRIHQKGNSLKINAKKTIKK